MAATTTSFPVHQRGPAEVGYGSTTFRREEKQRGLEPDECYCRDRDGEVPDITIEVIVLRGSIDKLHVYPGLGIREVWLFESGAFPRASRRPVRFDRDERWSSRRSTSFALRTTPSFPISTPRSARIATSYGSSLQNITPIRSRSIVGSGVFPSVSPARVICESSDGDASASSVERDTVVETGSCTPASIPRAIGFHTQRKPMRGFKNHVFTSIDSVYEPMLSAVRVAAAERDW